MANFDLVATMFGLDFGKTNVATRIVYGLVGLAAVYQVTQLRVLPVRWGHDRRTYQATIAIGILTQPALTTALGP